MNNIHWILSNMTEIIFWKRACDLFCVIHIFIYENSTKFYVRQVDLIDIWLSVEIYEWECWNTTLIKFVRVSCKFSFLLIFFLILFFQFFSRQYIRPSTRTYSCLSSHFAKVSFKQSTHDIWKSLLSCQKDAKEQKTQQQFTAFSRI